MKSTKIFICLVMLCLFLAVNTAISVASAIDSEEPPNQPGKITVKANQIIWEYEGKPFFKAKILTDAAKYRINTATDSSDGRTTQLLILTAKKWRDSIVVKGTSRSSTGVQCAKHSANRHDLRRRLSRSYSNFLSRGRQTLPSSAFPRLP